MRSLRDVRGRTEGRTREPLTSSMEGLAHARPNYWGERERAPTWWSQRDFCTTGIYVRTSSCTVTRATRKREAHPSRSPLQVLSTEQNISRRRNGFLQTLRCYARETGDRTEKTSCQYVDVCQRVRNHLSSLKAREKLAYVQ